MQKSDQRMNGKKHNKMEKSARNLDLVESWMLESVMVNEHTLTHITSHHQAAQTSIVRVIPHKRKPVSFLFNFDLMCTRM